MRAPWALAARYFLWQAAARSPVPANGVSMAQDEWPKDAIFTVGHSTRAIEDFQSAMIEAQKAIHDSSADTVVDIRGVEDAIVSAGEAAKVNPIDIQTAIQKADQGDIDGAFLFMQQKINEKGPLTLPVTLHATIPKLTIAGRDGTQMVIEVTPGSVGAPPAAPVAGTTNVYLPRGYRGDVVAQATGAARRNGRRYGAQGTVRYAR